jgi:hypothetical protein
VVCYRVPLDACGNPIVGNSGETTAPMAAPMKAREPTPAAPRKSGDASKRPELDSDAAAPQPVEADDNAPPKEKERPMMDLPSKKKSAPKSIYDQKST